MKIDIKAIALIFTLHLLMPPAVHATTSITLNRTSTWAVSILGVVILALIIYLFTVIFQPERF
ncbi:K(+)-transporting ATPase subunit F [Nostoc sp. TCL26-01]|uniref:K(+)-transporting ATPase subunit F n=1 Tax=Nostoc sp. TCL26-01 TaxID=2576904 RepID=UPI0015BB9841|nr:K(+)-transporting ATPase subunit F [Nostoc sp. TCL26-01]QLE54231.1 K(+)-transporting ATPase subunit F [Nostoc sp. TCL26-01]